MSRYISCRHIFIYLHAISEGRALTPGNVKTQTLHAAFSSKTECGRFRGRDGANSSQFVAKVAEIDCRACSVTCAALLGRTRAQRGGEVLLRGLFAPLWLVSKLSTAESMSANW